MFFQVDARLLAHCFQVEQNFGSRIRVPLCKVLASDRCKHCVYAEIAGLLCEGMAAAGQKKSTHRLFVASVLLNASNINWRRRECRLTGHTAHCQRASITARQPALERAAAGASLRAALVSSLGGTALQRERIARAAAFVTVSANRGDSHGSPD